MANSRKISGGFRKIKIAALLSAAAVLGTAQFASAAAFTWSNGASNNIWDTTSADWSGSGTMWVNVGTTTTPNTATFNGAAPSPTTVSLGVVGNVIDVGAITFTASGWVITGGTLNTSHGTAASALNAARTLTVSTAASTSDEIDSLIADADANDTVFLTKVGAGTLVLGHADTYSGPTTISVGTLTLNTAGSIASSALATSDGTTFNIQTTSATATNRVAAVTFNGDSTFNVNATGAGHNTSDAATGKLTLNAGATAFNVTPDTGFTSTFTFLGALPVQNTGGTIIFTGSNFGETSVGGTTISQVLFTTAPTLTGGTLGTTSAKILPYALVVDTALGVTTFATYDVTTAGFNGGIRALKAGEMTSTVATGVNWLVTGTGTDSGTTINSLTLGANSAAVTESSTLTVTSGGILSTGTGTSISGGTLAFGANAAYFHVTTGNDLTVNSATTGTKGVTLDGGGTLTFVGSVSGLSGTLAVSAGTLDVHGATETFAVNLGSAGTITNTSGTGNLTANESSTSSILSGKITDTALTPLNLVLNLTAASAAQSVVLSPATPWNYHGTTTIEGTGELANAFSSWLPTGNTVFISTTGGGVFGSLGTLANAVTFTSGTTFTIGDSNGGFVGTFSGAVTMQNNVTLTCNNGATDNLTFSNTITDATSTDTLTFSSNSVTSDAPVYILTHDNAYAGTMFINNAALLSVNSASVDNKTVIGNVVVGNGGASTASGNLARLRTGNPSTSGFANQFATTSIITIANPTVTGSFAVGVFDLDGGSQTIGGLATNSAGTFGGSGGTTDYGYVGDSGNGSATLTITASALSGVSTVANTTTFSGIISNELPTTINATNNGFTAFSAGGKILSLTVNGVSGGVQVLTGASTYTGATLVTGGTLSLSGAAGSPVILGGTAVTVGNGSSVNNGGTLQIANNVTMGTTALGTLTVIGGTTTTQGTLSLVDGTINTLTLANTTAATTLTIGGTTGNSSILNLEISSGGTSKIDEIVTTKAFSFGAGGATLNVTTLATPVDGVYTFLSAGSITGGGGSFLFSNATNTETVGSKIYTLGTSGATETLTVSDAVTVTATTYNLSSTAGSANVLLNGKTLTTSTITNTGSGTADTLNFTGLGLSATGGTISGPTTSGGPLNQGVASTPNSGQTFQGMSNGSAVLTPVVATATNGTIGGSATNNGTSTTTINVGNATADNTGSTSAFGTALTANITSSADYTNLSSTVTAVSGSGGAGMLGSTATILKGSSSSPSTVSMAWRTRTTSEVSVAPFTGPGPGLWSDVVQISDPNNDIYVLQITFDPSQAAAGSTPELGFFSGGTWVYAGSGTEMGAYNGTDLNVGDFGVNFTNDTVWAVVDQGGDFAAVPEPASLSLLGLAAIGLLGQRRRRTKA